MWQKRDHTFIFLQNTWERAFLFAKLILLSDMKRKFVCIIIVINVETLNARSMREKKK